jgi:hypothetical protein
VGFWLKVISFQYFQTAWMYLAEGRMAKALRDLALSILLWPCFLKTHRLNEPKFFRLRAMVRFIVQMFQPKSSEQSGKLKSA